jgi:hypothetical protein
MQIARHSSGLSGELDFAAEIVEASHEAQDRLGAITAGKVARRALEQWSKCEQ